MSKQRTVRVVVYETRFDPERYPRGGSRMVKGTCHALTIRDSTSSQVFRGVLDCLSLYGYEVYQRPRGKKRRKR